MCEDVSRTFSIIFSKVDGAFVATRDSTGTQYWVSTGGVLPPIGQRVHFAFTRKDGFVRIFFDGVLKGVGNLIAQKPLVPGTGSVIGSSNSMYPSVNGALEEFRATVGVARYTENFTPPDKPFPDR